MILSYLILAHLLGDFVLQPTKLVKWKAKEKKGMFIHALIHFLITTLLLLPIIIEGYFWLVLIALGLSLSHFLIDEGKISYSMNNDNKVKPFVMDQILHLLMILIIILFIEDIELNLPKTTFYELYTSTKVIISAYLIVLLWIVIGIYKFKKNIKHS